MVEKSEALEIFNGLMLGDGNLDFGGGSTARFRISRGDTREYRDYLFGIAGALEALGVSVAPDQPKSRVKISKGRASQMLDLDSRASPFLTEQYYLWIISNTPKRRKIPDYFTKITTLALTYWFESDGSTTWRGENLVRLSLCSGQFGRDGNLKLQQLLSDMGINIHLSRRWNRRTNGNYWGLETSNATTVNQFLDLVEPHIHPPYVYKMYIKLNALGLSD